MDLLVVFAFIAGAGTAISPCVLPVLPALLSASATGGRRRPLGIVLGLTVTFTVTIVGLAKVVDGVGLGDSFTRWLAIVVLFLFGLAVAIPAVGDRLEAPLSRLARFGPKDAGHGFWSGILVGAALGFVYAPCAGPILAAVVSVSAASGRSAAVGLAYSLGSALVLLLLALVGRVVIDRLRGKGQTVQRVLGGVMVLTAVAMAFQLDVNFQTTIANHLPAAVVNPTHSIEESNAVSARLTALRPASKFAKAQAASKNAPKGGADTYKDFGPAPNFTDISHWINSKPLTMAQLRGHVVLVDFWTYTCINCIRTLPHVTAWYAKYHHDGLTVVGVHSPEFSFEKETPNVERAVKQDGIKYPVAQDNNLGTWNAWNNEYWPAEYLIDGNGHVRYASLGEGDYSGTESAIRTLLIANGAKDLGGNAKPKVTYDPTQEATPETYVGARRAERFLPTVQSVGTNTYTAVTNLPQSDFTLGGTWDIAEEAARASAGATLTGNVVGKDVYLVLSPPAHSTGTVSVELDGKPIPTAHQTEDESHGVVHVTTQRLYHLFTSPQPEDHTLKLTFSPNVAAYAFTFG